MLPAAPDPDAVAYVTTVPGTTFTLGKTFAVSRDDAATLALNGVSAGALVLGTMTTPNC